jgi:L-ribulose-5-phosphate 3-epimerase
MPTTRREILSAAAAAAAAAAAPRPTKDDISLAAWSINRSFFVANRWKNADLPRICREEFGIGGLEFVNQFFDNPMQRHLQQVKKNAADHGVALVLIMVDGEGDMAARDRAERMLAAVSHRKWVDIAHFLGCHAIRCNLGGPRQDWAADKDLVPRAAESFRNLIEYARGSNLNVIIENHGGASSDPDVLVALMKEVNDPNFGTLPDFGNVNPGADHYEVIRKLMPYAKGVSVKAMWAADGTHPRYDLEKIIKICQDAGYHGFWGIESSFGGGRQQGAPQEQLTHDQIWEREKKGVLLTKQVLDRVVMKKGV